MFWEKKAIVTGSEGFIGGHLVDRLLEHGYSVLGIDNMSSGLPETLDSHLENANYISKQLDICDPRIKDVFKNFNPTFVFHLAAKPGVSQSVLDPVFYDINNVNGSLNVLEAARLSGVKRFVFSSSSSIYGGSKELPTKETCGPDPKSPYALQKLTVERYCKLYSGMYDIDTVSLRYFNVFGPRQSDNSAYAAVIAAFIRAERLGDRPIIYGSGNQFRDFTYVEDVVRANILAATSDTRLEGASINIGTGRSTTINDLCRTICSKRPVYKEMRAGDVFSSRADVGLAKEVLGHTSEWTLSAALKEFSIQHGVKNVRNIWSNKSK